MNFFNDEHRKNLKKSVAIIEQEIEKISIIKQQSINSKQYEIAANCREVEKTALYLISKIEYIEHKLKYFELNQLFFMKNEELPNLFKNATKELSQDGFFCCIFEWADIKYKFVDPELHSIAKNFIIALIQNKYPSDSITIEEIEITKQWEKRIDICVKINKTYLIIIEDKIHSLETNDQLDQYSEIAKKESYNNMKNVFIYLKTGNESRKKINTIVSKGWNIVHREYILDAFKNCKSVNNIFIDFYSNLVNTESQTNSYTYMSDLKQTEKNKGFYRASEGLYNAIQKKLSERVEGADWGYLSNRGSTYLGFWYFQKTIEDYKMYIQIDNHFDGELIFSIRIGNWVQLNLEKLRNIFTQLQDLAKKRDLILSKPTRFKVEKSSTSKVAVVKAMYSKEEKIDIDKLVFKLREIENLIVNYGNSYN